MMHAIIGIYLDFGIRIFCCMRMSMNRPVTKLHDSTNRVPVIPRPILSYYILTYWLISYCILQGLPGSRGPEGATGNAGPVVRLNLSTPWR